MKAVLVLNGEPPAPERLRSLAQHAPVYAADGGALACRDAGVVPRLVAGDFDSLPPDALAAEWTLHRNPSQDSTDFEKLLTALPEDIDALHILGGLGRRLDHLLTNLLIASALPPAISVVFEGETQELHRITPACPYAADRPIGSLLSLLPLAPVEGVRSRGLRWDLQDVRMAAGGQLGQSNRVTGPLRVEVGAGVLWLWHEGGAQSSGYRFSGPGNSPDSTSRA